MPVVLEDEFQLVEGQTPNHTRDGEAMRLGKFPEGFRLLGGEVGLQKYIMTLSILPGHLTFGYFPSGLKGLGRDPPASRPAIPRARLPWGR